MTTRTRTSLLDLAPAAALLGVWATAGLASARETGDLHLLALGVVTIPALVLIARAIRFAGRSARVARPDTPVTARR